jgi:arylformamidase
MKIVDITRELFSAPVYPGDPKPELEPIRRLENGDHSNLSVLHACLHNGTHMDAPLHFCEDGKDISDVSLHDCIGECSVVEWNGYLTGADVEKMLSSLCPRVLFKGNVQITSSAAFALSDRHITLIGVESQTVEPDGGNGAVHRQLLGADMVLLEGIDLSAVSEGIYFLFVAPLKMKGADGCPVRAVLLERQL